MTGTNASLQLVSPLTWINDHLQSQSQARLQTCLAVMSQAIDGDFRSSGLLTVGRGSE